MSSHELPFGLITHKATIVLLFLLKCLLLLRYVFLVSHSSFFVNFIVIIFRFVFFLCEFLVIIRFYLR